MKAMTFTQYGSPDFLELKDVQKPAPKDDEVLINIRAASINSWDWELMLGTPFVNRLMFGLLRPKKVQILGADVAGRVEAVGEKVTQFQPGDEVFGDLSGCGWGGFAEYVSTRENALSLMPGGVTFDEAAALPQAGLLALQGLRDAGGVQPGQRILINGAGGGVGSFAIQMAKTFGAEVTGVDSAIKLDIMSSLGAKHVIDYTKADFTKSEQTYDFILDVAAHHSFFDYKRVLNPGGIYVMVGGAASPIYQALLLGPLISRMGSRKMGILMHKPNKDMALLKKLVEDGKVSPVIGRCYPLSKVADALKYFGEGKAQGKIVITMEERIKNDRGT